MPLKFLRLLKMSMWINSLSLTPSDSQREKKQCAWLVSLQALYSEPRALLSPITISEKYVSIPSIVPAL
jgi:hypothetical protein